MRVACFEMRDKKVQPVGIDTMSDREHPQSRISNPESRPPLLDVQNLSVHFGLVADPVRAVDEVDFQIFPGEIVALVGESGSGKSVSALALAQLVPEPAGRIEGGKVFFQPLENKKGVASLSAEADFKRRRRKPQPNFY